MYSCVFIIILQRHANSCYLSAMQFLFSQFELFGPRCGILHNDPFSMSIAISFLVLVQQFHISCSCCGAKVSNHSAVMLSASSVIFCANSGFRYHFFLVFFFLTYSTLPIISPPLEYVARMCLSFRSKDRSIKFLLKIMFYSMFPVIYWKSSYSQL